MKHSRQYDLISRQPVHPQGREAHGSVRVAYHVSMKDHCLCGAVNTPCHESADIGIGDNGIFGLGRPHAKLGHPRDYYRYGIHLSMYTQVPECKHRVWW